MTTHVTTRTTTIRTHEGAAMYTRAMQRIRRTAHQRRVHEAQRMARVAAEREQMRAVMHTYVR